MNFRRLKYFVKIVDTGSLMPAAEVLHIASLMCRQITVAETDCNERFNAERLRQRMRYL